MKPRKGTFGGPKWQAGKGANADSRVSIIRRGMTNATNKYGIGGALKVRKRPLPSLPPTPWDRDKAT